MRFFPLFFRLVHQKCLSFGTKVNLDNTYTLAIFKLLVRRMLIRENLEFSPRPFVRPSRSFSKTVHYFFSGTLQLVRTCKGGKNVPSTFLKKSRFANFGQKLSKIGHLAGCVQQSL